MKSLYAAVFFSQGMEAIIVWGFSEMMHGKHLQECLVAGGRHLAKKPQHHSNGCCWYCCHGYHHTQYRIHGQSAQYLLFPVFFFLNTYFKGRERSILYIYMFTCQIATIGGLGRSATWVQGLKVSGHLPLISQVHSQRPGCKSSASIHMGYQHCRWLFNPLCHNACL